MLQFRVPCLHLIMGNNCERRRFRFGRQQIPDPDRNANEESAGCQEIQEVRAYPTREFRAKSVNSKVDAGQNPKTPNPTSKPHSPNTIWASVPNWRWIMPV